jgi:hypothetical protein
LDTGIFVWGSCFSINNCRRYCFPVNFFSIFAAISRICSFFVFIYRIHTQQLKKMHLIIIRDECVCCWKCDWAWRLRVEGAHFRQGHLIATFRICCCCGPAVAQGWKLIFLGPRARTPAVMKTPHYFARTHVTLYMSPLLRDAHTYTIVTRGADVNARLLPTERRWRNSSELDM